MKKTQFDLLVIHDFEEAVFHLPTHSHTYYELVYIHKGKGIHVLNQVQHPYRSGDLFVISPEDEHYFQIAKSTHFTFIKFTDSYFASHKLNRSEAILDLSPEDIMRNKMLKEVKLKVDEPCTTILRKTIENIVAYNCRQDIALSPLIFYQILSIFGLIREATSKLGLSIDTNKPGEEELISYINQHIYSPSAVQIHSIATHFNIAPTYFSAYFKKHFDISYRSYLNAYRIKLIEKRLEISNLTLGQIASEFGFTDESHLIRFFKKIKKENPGTYRKLSGKGYHNR